MFDYLKYSAFNITLKLNPFHWRFAFNSEVDIIDGKVYIAELAMFTIKICIDNGDW